jgi:hypothetical protein
MISKLSSYNHHHNNHHQHNENNNRSHHVDNDTSSIEACLMDVYLYKQLTTETITTSTRSSASSNGGGSSSDTSSSSSFSSSSSSRSSTSKSREGKIKDISKFTSKFIIITYSTDNIIDYTLYSFGINALYAHSKSQHHHYHHHHHHDHNPIDATINIYSTSPSGGFEYESRDQRWNKVKIIEVLLSQLQQHMYRNQSSSSSSSSSSPDSSQVEYIVWMDSDLIILNFNFDFNHITTRYPTADIIISRDAYPDNGMVNTGMILRNKLIIIQAS